MHWGRRCGLLARPSLSLGTNTLAWSSTLPTPQRSCAREERNEAVEGIRAAIAALVALARALCARILGSDRTGRHRGVRGRLIEIELWSELQCPDCLG